MVFSEKCRLILRLRTQFQALLASSRHENSVEMTLVESHPKNVGPTERFRAIPSSLFAFAARFLSRLAEKGSSQSMQKPN